MSAPAGHTERQNVSGVCAAPYAGFDDSQHLANGHIGAVGSVAMSQDAGDGLASPDITRAPTDGARCPRLPARRPELLLRPLGEQGRYVVKDPHTGGFFLLGEQEFFLFEQLDGERDAISVA